MSGAVFLTLRAIKCTGFNVALTRAMALLIVVGDPRVLKDDDNWGALLSMCVAKGAYTGAPLRQAQDDATLEALRGQMEGLMHADEVGSDSSDVGGDSDEEIEAAPSQR
jgi:hypothetical protein